MCLLSGIDNDIEDMVVKCSACLEFSKNEQKQSMIPHDLPSSPWQKLGSDLFEFEGQHYLIVQTTIVKCRSSDI